MCSFFSNGVRRCVEFVIVEKFFQFYSCQVDMLKYISNCYELKFFFTSDTCVMKFYFTIQNLSVRFMNV